MRISDWSSDVCSSDLVHGTPNGWFRLLQTQRIAFATVGVGLGALAAFAQYCRFPTAIGRIGQHDPLFAPTHAVALDQRMAGEWAGCDTVEKVAQIIAEPPTPPMPLTYPPAARRHFPSRGPGTEGARGGE